MGPRPRTLVAIFLSIVLASGTLAQATPDASSSPPPEPSFLSRHRRTLLLIAGSGAVACGIGAIVSRSSANDRYDEYQQTADPDRIQSLYRETERLDNRAAALFISSEALFLATLYLGFFVPSPHEHQGVAVTAREWAEGPSSPEPDSEPVLHLVPAPGGLAVRWRF